MRLGVLVSGEGHMLQAVLDAIGDGRLDAEIPLVVSSNQTAPALRTAAEAGIQTLSLYDEIYQDPVTADMVIATELHRAGVDHLALLGYTRLAYLPLLDLFDDRILCVHPSLLPAFPELHAVEEAWSRGVKTTGATAYIAVPVVGAGPIVAQEPVAVPENCTLEELKNRVREAECAVAVRALASIAQGKVSIDADRKVHIDE